MPLQEYRKTEIFGITEKKYLKWITMLERELHVIILVKLFCTPNLCLIQNETSHFI